LLAVAVERGELTQESDEGTFAETVVDVGVEGYCTLEGNSLNDWSITYPVSGTPCSDVEPRQPIKNVSFDHQSQSKAFVIGEGMCEMLLREPPPICLSAEAALNSKRITLQLW
jgi:hypothetical protein